MSDTVMILLFLHVRADVCDGCLELFDLSGF